MWCLCSTELESSTTAGRKEAMEVNRGSHCSISAPTGDGSALISLPGLHSCIEVKLEGSNKSVNTIFNELYPNEVMHNNYQAHFINNK